MTTLETERLVLRRFAEQDLDAFDVVGADHVISLINPQNTASIRVAEKLGGRLQRRIEMFGGETLVYGVDRAG